jgi:hypothetical protein
MCDVGALEHEENDHAGEGGEFAHFQKGSKKKKDELDSVTLTLAHRVENYKRLMRFDTGEEFVMMAGLDHASLIKTSLDKIFRTYVRGNAVHANAKSGS